MIRDFVSMIRAYCTERKVAPSRLAVDAGLASGALRYLYSDAWSPRIETQEALLKQIPEDFVRAWEGERAA